MTTNTNNFIVTDSGLRESYNTGAVRDITAGKSRVDLIHHTFISLCQAVQGSLSNTSGLGVLQIDMDTFDGQAEALASLLKHRNNVYEALLELGDRLAGGAEKYGERNWEKGIPNERYIESFKRHYCQFMAGVDDGENHYAACLFNLMGLIYNYVMGVPK